MLEQLTEREEIENTNYKLLLSFSKMIRERKEFVLLTKDKIVKVALMTTELRNCNFLTLFCINFTFIFEKQTAPKSESEKISKQSSN